MYACDYEGDGRAYLKFFFACPVGGEMCGPEFTPDGRTLFVAVQHPAEADAFASTFEQPDDPLAGLRRRRAAAPLARGDHQGRRRRDRQLSFRRDHVSKGAASAAPSLSAPDHRLREGAVIVLP